MTTLTLSLHDIFAGHLGTSIEIPVTIELDRLIEEADTDEHEIDLDDILATQRQIGFVWCIEDVQQQRPDLDEDQCWEVLKHCKASHDANIGMNWDVIDCVADMLFGLAPDEDDDAEKDDE